MPGYLSAFNISNGQFSDAQLQSFIPDMQDQLGNEFWWAWGLYSYIDVNGGGAPIIITDYPQAGEPQDALGYHWEYNGQPYAVIFAGLCNDYGYPVTGVISHEVLELAADQEANSWNLWDFGDGTGVLVIQEVCDPCESALYYEGPNGNIVSDFAFPQWWVPGYTGQVDYLGQVPAPLTLGPSGDYITYFYATLNYQQIMDDKLMQRLIAAQQQRAAQGNPRQQLVQRAHSEALKVPSPATLLSSSGQPVRTGQQSSMQTAQDGRRAQAAGQQPSAPRSQGTGGKKANITVVKRADVPTNGTAANQGNGTSPSNGGGGSGGAAGAAGAAVVQGPRVQRIPASK